MKNRNLIGVALAAAAAVTAAGLLLWQMGDAGRGTRDAGELSRALEPAPLTDADRQAVETAPVRRVDQATGQTYFEPCYIEAPDGRAARLLGNWPDGKWLNGQAPPVDHLAIVIYTAEWDAFLAVPRPDPAWPEVDIGHAEAAFVKAVAKVQAALDAETDPKKRAALEKKLARFQAKKLEFQNADTKEEQREALRAAITEVTKEVHFVAREKCFLEFSRIAKERLGVEWEVPRL